MHDRTEKLTFTSTGGELSTELPRIKVKWFRVRTLVNITDADIGSTETVDDVAEITINDGDQDIFYVSYSEWATLADILAGKGAASHYILNAPATTVDENSHCTFDPSAWGAYFDWSKGCTLTINHKAATDVWGGSGTSYTGTWYVEYEPVDSGDAGKMPIMVTRSYKATSTQHKVDLDNNYNLIHQFFQAGTANYVSNVEVLRDGKRIEEWKSEDVAGLAYDYDVWTEGTSQDNSFTLYAVLNINANRGAQRRTIVDCSTTATLLTFSIRRYG
jgi:hypothetical protein